MWRGGVCGGLPWKDVNGEVHSKWLSSRDAVPAEGEQEKPLYARLEAIGRPETLSSAVEKQLFFNYAPLIRSKLGEFGTKKLAADLSAHQCDRPVTPQEDEIIRGQFGLSKYRGPGSDSDEGYRRYIGYKDLTSEKHSVAVLRERLQEVELADLKILTDLAASVDNGLADIQKQQKSDSAFKTQLTDCKLKIEKILSSSTHQYAVEHRADIKIHRVVQALVDTYNEIKDSKKGRSFAGLFGGSKTALQIETLLQTIQQKFSDHPNYAFTLKRIEGEKIELKWTEEFKDDGARLAITGSPASTLRIK
ncbi:MAG: hypothetical protein CO120_03760 [Gammaproteobacteria bacterium CG_4_9_14_3_um_filter_38_9]|nr:MAG: hypothetical protein CO120_03760 [Gammaproteobacteria bacterium CG_4_9_14_3_um_filter_38_9]